MNKFALIAATGIVGIFVFWLLAVLWFTFLNRLAKHYSVENRRKIASITYIFLVMPLFGGCCVGEVSILLSLHSPNFAVALAFFVSVAPAFYWFSVRRKTLRALGYGRNIEGKSSGE